MHRVTITEDRTGRTIKTVTKPTHQDALIAAYELIDRHHSEADGYRMSNQIFRTGTADGVYRYEPVTYRVEQA